MRFSSWSAKWQGIAPTRRRPVSRRRRLASPPPVAALESLEERVVLSAFTAATAAALIADINAVNKAGGANTITLTAPTTSPYLLTARDNVTNNSANMLPVIAPGDALTIQTGNGSASPGYGDTLDASKVGRLFDVAQGASLTLDNLTLQKGFAGLFGGAIYNRGTLDLSHVLVQYNTADNSSSNASGGGIWSSGSLTVENSCMFQGNVAQGFYNAYGGAICIVGGTANVTGSTFGLATRNSVFFTQNQADTLANSGRAYGGAVYADGATVTMSGDTVGIYNGGGAGGFGWSNSAGEDSTGQHAYGGGLCVAGGTVTLTNDSISGNEAGHSASFDMSGTLGAGGGIFIASGAHVSLDSFTQANTKNDAPGGPRATQNIQVGHIPGYYLLPQIGSFTASSNSIAAGSSLTLTASISYNPYGISTTQVSFYYLDSSGAKHVLGNATQTSPNVWPLTIKANLTPGTYTLYAQAENGVGVGSGLFSDPLSLSLTVH